MHRKWYFGISRNDSLTCALHSFERQEEKHLLFRRFFRYNEVGYAKTGGSAGEFKGTVRAQRKAVPVMGSRR